MTDSLSSLVQLMDAKNHAAKLHRGLRSLPCELLAYIIELACVPYSADHVRIASVNRQFRQMILSNTRLWTYVSTAHSNRFVQLQIDRSGEHGLSVVVVPREKAGSTCFNPLSTCPCVGVLKVLVNYARRWNELTIMDIHNQFDNDRPITMTLKNVCFPTLKRLTLGAVIRESHYAEALSSWTMPRLHSLTCAPESCISGCLPSSRSFHANFDWMRASLDLYNRTKALMETLSYPAMANLEDLVITLPTMFRYGHFGEKSKVIHLAQLRSLSLGKCAFPRLADYVISHILSRLSMPSLESISFRLDNHWRGDDDLLLLRWFEVQDFKHLNRVHVRVCEKEKPDNVPELDFFERIRQAFLTSSRKERDKPPLVTHEIVIDEPDQDRQFTPHAREYHLDHWGGFGPGMEATMLGDTYVSDDNEYDRENYDADFISEEDEGTCPQCCRERQY
jgi:hypothetical protein